MLRPLLNICMQCCLACKQFSSNITLKKCFICRNCEAVKVRGKLIQLNKTLCVNSTHSVGDSEFSYIFKHNVILSSSREKKFQKENMS